MASKIRTEWDKQEEKIESLSMKLINVNKEEFGRTARSFVTYLFNTVQKLKRPTGDIVKGHGAFNLQMLLIGRDEHAVYCFTQLFMSFKLRSYFEADKGSICRDEYRSFIDELRRAFSELVQPTLLVKDTVKLLSDQPALRSCPLLLKHFRLSCLCLDEPFETLPAVKFGFVDSDDPTSSHIDAILPVQSYFLNVSREVKAVTKHRSLSSFLQLEPTFGGSGLSDTYCPWLSVDFFGPGQIIEQLVPAKTYRQNPEDVLVSSTASSAKPSAPKILERLIQGLVFC